MQTRQSGENPLGGYYFSLSANGAYTLLKFKSGSFETLVPWKTHWAIRNRGFNSIRALHFPNDSIVLEINGVVVEVTQDNEFNSGKVGLFAFGVQKINFDIMVALDMDQLLLTKPSVLPLRSDFPQMEIGH